MRRDHPPLRQSDLSRQPAFFRLILFNSVTSNDIEHDEEYRLSPANALVNTALQLRKPRIFALDKGLFNESMATSDTRTIRRTNFEEFDRRIGLPGKGDNCWSVRSFRRN